MIVSSLSIITSQFIRREEGELGRRCLLVWSSSERLSDARNVPTTAAGTNHHSAGQRKTRHCLGLPVRAKFIGQNRLLFPCHALMQKWQKAGQFRGNAAVRPITWATPSRWIRSVSEPPALEKNTSSIGRKT
jgi:hypothetical protein